MIKVTPFNEKEVVTAPVSPSRQIDFNRAYSELQPSQRTDSLNRRKDIRAFEDSLDNPMNRIYISR